VSDDLKVLLIEDEDSMRRFLRPALSAQGYRVIEATTGAEGLRLAGSHNPDVVVLDLGLPDMDGTLVTQQLRQWSQTPIIILSARGQEADKVHALDAGADDYLTKPFGLPELLARIRVTRRRAEALGLGPSPAESVLAAGSLHVDLGRRRVTVEGREVRLTPLEYKLLLVLLRHTGKVLTHRQLLKEVWGPDRAGQTQYLHVYMGHLRSKLEADPARPRLLITEPGVGYRFDGDLKTAPPADSP
jgi:two-component system KDP operon response regulator KdpE